MGEGTLGWGGRPQEVGKHLKPPVHYRACRFIRSKVGVYLVSLELTVLAACAWIAS